MAGVGEVEDEVEGGVERAGDGPGALAGEVGEDPGADDEGEEEPAAAGDPGADIACPAGGAAVLGIDRPIVIDVSDERLPDNLPKSAFDVILKTEEIASEHRRNIQLQRASLVLRPIRGNFHWADYSAATEFIQMGYENTLEHMREIRGIANARRVFGLMRFKF